MPPSGISGLRRLAADHHFRAECGVLLLVTAVTTGLTSIGLLYPIERFIIDLFAVTEPTRPSAHTVLIDIDEDSFQSPDGFNRNLQTSPARLAQLIFGVGRAKPRAIVLDIEIDHPEAVTAELERLRAAAPAVVLPPIVWTVGAKACGESLCVIPNRSSSATEPGAERLSGISMLLLDGDGVVRRYLPEFQIASEDQGGGCACTEIRRPSLPRAAVLASGESRHARAEGEDLEPLLLNWKGDRFNFSQRFRALQVLKDSTSAWWEGAAQPIEGRIAVIGGTFTEGRDEKVTPAGRMAGVEVMSQIIEAEMEGGGMAPFSERLAILLDLVSGLALIMLNRQFAPGDRRRLVVNGALGLLLPFAASWLLYRFAIYWVNLAPVLAGVWLHQWSDRKER